MTLHWNTVFAWFNLWLTFFALQNDESDWPIWTFYIPVYITVSGLEWTKAQQVASSKQLLLIFLYNHVCYGSTLIGYHVTPVYPQSPLRLGCRLWLLYYWTTEVSASRRGGIHSKSTVSSKLKTMYFASIFLLQLNFHIVYKAFVPFKAVYWSLIPEQRKKCLLIGWNLD